ncbi:bifunctional [glutamate--ammonia ligase]-adenylyl-L-tyrosine phosphorylase/[glutamate--ammonia-ligase] adenylyltransferase [Sphingomonas spermidinifaciens]|uniref:Bifunctional [glutamate--ammonia ligase]-adenylyl-L-tyrosine phosphorylase/[glutamate--ammonia-ligase] adenylyltransferase n=1 Tax=Sphingomonas spermidinifaciens TaxID=1141889 RepID=A0A2A4B7K8_9SPHN|nr:bifunctional [glutamine synthetase] adenylyltransferase/[glutamine synthetase]-adenylyl-L-tyrosine phosphorylase [Sphingomonas spermidinifaciens]PCD03942.1 bifunctional [glutamate--ammonia ligase]-adenylyl-L-tyrosine phosphorylase/[glutamate--ammonia-ligase] adenylyltransferase [Sphingomonas spermidinifaciens]
MMATVDPVTISQALVRACDESPFLRLAAQREPGVAAEAAQLLADPVAAAFDGLADLSVAARLRRARWRLALLVALADLSGEWPFEQVVATLTDFADRALDLAIRAAIEERTPGAEPGGFTAIALGKQGSHELNYSSDIDPILLFDPATLPTRPREEPQEAAVRIGKRVVELLQSRDGDGYVLRVDLRLRPSSEVTPIALPVEAAIGYYESAALPWERAAFIRARACAGDVALGQRFLGAIAPFVWRRSLDFGAIAEIRGITARIRDHHAQGQAFGPGYDLKRGRGGIREIEFFAQIHQLIHGGRDPSLRAPATLDALAALGAAGRIGVEEARILAEAYRRLRTVEHRVQMIDDRQTHALPARDSLDRVARLDGLADGATLLSDLRPHIEAVGRIYDALEPETNDRLPDAEASLSVRLEAAGFADAGSAVRRVAEWRSGGYPALRSAPARAALEDVLPGLIAALGEAPDPDAALLRLDRMLAKLPSAINFFRLIDARPQLARLLATVLALAPTLADALGRRAELLDGLIDASALEPVGEVADLVAAMRVGTLDYEQRLDHVRRVVAETRFALGVQIVAGARDPLEVAGGYARLAEAAIETLTSATVEDFERAHGRVPDSELVILALGRLGGGALTHASDLDLVYLFTGDHAAESDGKRPLGAVHYYNRLAQRVTAALSVPTASGPLYPVDTRLRPSGNQGPLVVSLEGFRRYQTESAWTWEHMALTRARPVFGSAAARASTQAIVDAVLRGERSARGIAADAAAMRAEMRAHKPAQGPLDAKLLDGGLVDLEFAVHVRQLVHRTAFSPDLRVAIGALVGGGLAQDELIAAHDLLTRLIVTLRLVAPDAQAPPPPTKALIARALGLADWEAVTAALAEVRQAVGAAWKAVQRDER